MKNKFLIIGMLMIICIVSIVYLIYKVNSLTDKISNDSYKIQEYQKFVNYALSHNHNEILKFQEGEYSISKYKSMVIFEPNKSFLDYYGLTIQYDSIDNNKIKEIWLHKP